MKKALLTILIGFVGSSLWAQDFAYHPPHVTQPTKGSKVISQKHVDGAFVRAARFSNPLQALNPLAPAEYGDGSEFVYYDENDSYQRRPGGTPVPKGIRLFCLALW